MSKRKAAKSKPAKRGRSRADVAAEPAPPVPDTARARPAGQRLYDMPYSAPAPRLINPELDLHNLVTRAGHNAGYSIDVTVLDAPDHRLIRSGVLLAHRVLDGRGEWYMGAPEWQPVLPKERIVPMGHSDLPEDFADLIRPFRRRATLGPTAALTCERREFALRDDKGTTMALLRDDKVTIRRGGLTTARFREVMLTPTGPGLTEEQAGHVAHALAGAGATQVPKFPRLVTRLGAPATGPTDFPLPHDLGQDLAFALFVSNLLATRLRQILWADLAVRTSDPDGAAELSRSASQLRFELEGLASAVDQGWLNDLDEELEWVAEQAERDSLPGSSKAATDAVADLRGRLRGERYLTLLERLVTATRAPKVGHSSVDAASDVLGGLLDAALAAVVKTAGRLSVDSPHESWDAARRAFDNLFRVSQVATHVLGQRVEELRRRLEPPALLLGEAGRHDQLAQHQKELVAQSTPAEAFELGRRFENELSGARTARDAFVRHWDKTVKKLG